MCRGHEEEVVRHTQWMNNLIAENATLRSENVTLRSEVIALKSDISTGALVESNLMAELESLKQLNANLIQQLENAQETSDSLQTPPRKSRKISTPETTRKTDRIADEVEVAPADDTKPDRHILDDMFSPGELYEGRWFSDISKEFPEYSKSTQAQKIPKMTDSMKKFRAYLDYHEKYYVDQNKAAIPSSDGEDLDGAFSRGKYSGRTYSGMERLDPGYAAYCFVDGKMNTHGERFCDYLKSIGYTKIETD